MLLAVLGALLVAKTPLPEHRYNLIVYDPVTLVVRMVVVPDHDAQLNDPAWVLKDCGTEKAPIACAVALAPKEVEPVEAVREARKVPLKLPDRRTAEEVEAR